MIRCNLAVLMAERNLKITKVAMDTGISRTTLTSLSNNQSQGIQFETLNTICKYLKISPDKMFSYLPFDIEITDVKIQNISNIEISITIYEQRQVLNFLLLASINCLTKNDYKTIDSIEIDISMYESDDTFTKKLIESFISMLPLAFFNDLEYKIKNTILFNEDVKEFILSLNTVKKDIDSIRTIIIWDGRLQPKQ